MRRKLTKRSPEKSKLFLRSDSSKLTQLLSRNICVEDLFYA
jgi:hypothetical protein